MFNLNYSHIELWGATRNGEQLDASSKDLNSLCIRKMVVGCHSPLNKSYFVFFSTLIPNVVCVDPGDDHFCISIVGL